MITPGTVLKVLGGYQLLECLGRGGSGEVWRAEPRAAIKVVSNPDAEHWLAEVRALAALDHPNVLAVLDHGRADEHAWMATELCSGGSLAKHGPRNWNHLRRVVGDLLEALAYAHARGVLHRDLTPENVLLAGPDDLRPGIKLGDFGLADPRRVARVVHTPSGRQMQVAGTPAYMAPEQFSGELDAHGPWTDMYGLGCLIWRLCTGAAPFGDARPAAVLAAAHAGVDLPAFEPLYAVPPGLPVLLHALLAKSPEARVQSAAEALDALDVVDGVAPRGVPANWRGRPGRRLLSTAASLFSFRTIPLVGRDTERDLLWQALLSREARRVHLWGEPGMGRRALARWLAERALETGAARVAWVDTEQADSVAALSAALTAVWPTVPADRVGLGGAETLADLGAKVTRGGRVLLVLPEGRYDDAARAALRHLDRVNIMALSLAAREVAGQSIALGPLSAVHLVMLVEGLLGFSGVSGQAIREASGGNPGLATELGADVVSGELAIARLPTTLAGLWRERVGRLGAPTRGVQLAALLGTRVSEQVWASAAEAGGITEGVWPELVARGLAYPLTGGWRWAHALAAEAVLANAPADAALHAICAGAFAGVDEAQRQRHLRNAKQKPPEPKFERLFWKE